MEDNREDGWKEGMEWNGMDKNGPDRPLPPGT